MKKFLIPVILCFGAVFLLSTNAIGLTITDPIIAFEPDPNFDGTLSATLDLSGSSNRLTVRLTNTTALDSPIDYDFPSTILATGFGLNLGYDVIGGGVSDYGDTINFSGSPAPYWGYGTTNNFNTPLQGTPYSVDTTVTTLTAYVDNPFALGGIIDGPKHGLLSDFYPDPSTYPVIQDFIEIYLDLDLSGVSGFNWDDYLNGVASADVVVAFGSPTAVPEPATMLLLGSGLVGLAGFGRKKFFKR